MIEATLHRDAEKLRNAKQAEIRKLCKPWGVTSTAKSPQGTYPRRSDADLKRDIAQTNIERARELQQQIGPATQSTATEHAEIYFYIEYTVTEALHRLQAGSKDVDVMPIIVDHDCHSQDCISHRVAAMCREANWQTSTDMCNDQPLDVCGYIAADTVCRLREAALAEANSWHRTRLPDYAQLECIHRGNTILNKGDDDRILDADEVNRLVCHYSRLKHNHQ